jgi:hypothetical protein
MIFKGHAFTKKPVSFEWEINGYKVGSGEKIEYCFSEVPKTYKVELNVEYSQNPRISESIFHKILVKTGIIPKVFENVKETIELISMTLKEKLTEIGRSVRDKVLIRVIHSQPTPVGIIDVHFEKAKENIDLSGLEVDFSSKDKKVLLYMKKWPSTIERSKTVLIAK